MTTPDHTAAQAALAAAQTAITADEKTEDAQLVALQGQLVAAQQNLAAETADDQATHAALATALAQIAALQAQNKQPRGLWGMAVGGNSAPTQFETAAGRPIGLHRTYWEPGQEAQMVAMVKADVAAGRAAWVSIKLPHTWAQAKTGADDAWATSLIAQLAALGGWVLLTFHHEPELDQTPITDFLAVHRRLYALKPASATKLLVGPIFTAYNWFYGPKQNPTEFGAFQPSLITADLGDFIGWDSYETYGEDTSHTKWVDMMATYWQPIAVLSKALGRTWAIGEWGISHNDAAYEEAQNKKITTMQALYSYAQSEGNCIGVCYFDSNLNSKTDWRIETDTATPDEMTTFVTLLKGSPRP